MKIIRVSVCIRGKSLRIHNGRDFHLKFFARSSFRVQWELVKNSQEFPTLCTRLKDLSIEIGLKGFVFLSL